MMLNYQDTATFFTTQAAGYANDKIVDSQDDVPVIFLQNTGFNRTNNQETDTADAICYPDPTSAFILANHHRLEGMYILAPLFGMGDDDGWYKVTAVNVNRDHLLGNEVENIELRLKRTTKLAGVS